MSKDPDPVSPEALANLRRTLPGLGTVAQKTGPMQELSPDDVERALRQAQEPAQTSSSSLEVLTQTQPPAVARSVSNPALLPMRSVSNPALLPMRSASNSALLPLRGVSQSAMPLLRTTGNPAASGSHALPPRKNLLPLAIGGLSVVAIAIFTAAWLYPTKPTSTHDVGKPPAPKELAISVRPANPAPVPVIVEASSPTAPVVPIVPAVPAVPARPANPAPVLAVPTTTSKPSVLRNNGQPTVKPALPSPVAAKAPKLAPLDLSPVSQLSREILRKHMLHAEPKWVSCPKDGSGKNLTLSIVVAPSGSVVRTQVMGPVESTQTAQCVKNHIQSMRFPPYSEGETKTFVWSYQAP
ncbi:MAG TPA: hypothetical protein PKE31_15325 [Pseudomonadota bacterium]|jgi:hypothetical protein|nr:hypothetical protein [Pseudomonadota bacterium]